MLANVPSATKSKEGKHDPEMHQAERAQQYHFGIKAHVGVDANFGLVHSVVGTAANVSDISQVDQLLHCEEYMVGADAGYASVEKCPEHDGRKVIWQVASCHSPYMYLSNRCTLYKAEHSFRVMKRQLSYMKTRFRGLVHDTVGRAVCAVKPADGAQAFAGNYRRGICDEVGVRREILAVAKALK